MGEVVGILVGAGIIFMMVYGDIGCTERRFVETHSKEPYCKSEKILDKEYKRCWKVIEVEP